MFSASQQAVSISGIAPAAGIDRLRVVITGEISIRETLANVAGSFEDVSVVDELDADEQLAPRLRLLTPDVVLCDAGREITALAPVVRLPTPALVLVGSQEQRSFATAAGVRGIIDRTATPRRIHAAIVAVAEGLRVTDSPAAEPLDEPHPGAETLTARELDVLRLLADGRTNKEIAHRLGITEHTVKFHVNAILGKLEAETRTEAVVNAARRGIVVL